MFCTAYLCVSLAFVAQTPDSKDVPERKGSIEGGNTYHNSTLQMKISLPGAWHVFNRTMYSTPESKQKEKKMVERRNRATCQGPLCGDPEIDVALQTDTPFVHAIFLTAYKLSLEYQNRQRHPLKEFAESMWGSLGDGWVPEGELTAIRLDGRLAYRLIIHSKRTTTAKGFAYVADSNGRIFLLLGTAMSEPEKLQSAIENMTFTNADANIKQNPACAVRRECAVLPRPDSQQPYGRSRRESLC